MPEPENLLKQELREPAIYNSVIAAVAGGASRSNEIATKIGIDAPICAKYLKVLLDIGILIKKTPITEKPGKKTVYAIGDNFFKFWYRFVPQNTSSISAGRIEHIFGSCKYKNEPIGIDELELLKEYAGVFGKGKKYYYYIFSKSGFTNGLKELAEKGGVRLVSLEEMYK